MKKLRPIFLASFFFSIHLALLTYLNSSMLGQYTNGTLVSAIYTLASAFSLVCILYAPKIIARIGLLKFSMYALLMSIAMLSFLGTTTNLFFVLLTFLIYLGLNSLILYIFDLYIEHYSSNESTGNIRGTYLLFNNIGWVFAPIVSGYLTNQYGFSVMYTFASFIALVTLLILAASQRKFKDRPYANTSIVDAYHQMRASKPIRRIVSINFMLQFFYAWMVIYIPLYLHTVIDLSWTKIGLLFSIMLLPFALFEYPVGRILDRLGEKIFIICGLLIMSFSTILLPTLGNAPFIIYAGVLFATRVGAAILEVSCESYFFKRLDDRNISLISLYRNTIPIAYIIGPMLAAGILIFATYQTLFVILSILLFLAAIYSFRIKNS